MNNKKIAFGVVGVVIGFIAGFFVANIRESGQAPLVPQGAQASSSSSAIPEDHPGQEVMEMMLRLQQRAEDHPEDAEVRVVLGNAYYDMKRFDAAIRWYEEALKIDSNNINASTDLGTAYYYSGNPEKALEHFDHSLGLDANHPQTLQNLGVVHLSLGNRAKAIGAWNKLLQTNPSYEHAPELRQQIERVEEEMKSGDS